MFDLRDYQNTLVDETREAFRLHRRVLIVSPTGSGKAVVLAYVAHHAAAKGNRIILIVHRDELLDQLSGSLSEMDVPHGRIQPGWPMTDEPVQIGMVQTLVRRLEKTVPPDLLFFDEAHHAVSNTYRKIARYWPNVRIIGATATPLRLDGKGLKDAFDTMVMGPGTRALIDAGWLADFDYLAPPDRVDMAEVRIEMGDYNVEDLARETDKPRITGDVIEHYKGHLLGKPTIAFCVRVDHAEHVAAAFRAAGVKAVSVDGNTPAAERQARIAGLGNGNTEVLTSCMLVGEGLDIPAVAGAILLRKTKSLAMFLQWIGRTLRLKRDSSRALILDHVDCVREHGLPDEVRDWTLDGKPAGVAPTTTCQLCYRVFRVYPGWKLEQVCKKRFEPGCALFEKPVVKKPDRPEEGPGTLVAYTRRPNLTQAGETTPGSHRPAWARGIDIKQARGSQYFELIRRAQTREQIEEIRIARNYNPYWTVHVMRAKRSEE